MIYFYNIFIILDILFNIFSIFIKFLIFIFYFSNKLYFNIINKYIK